MTVGAEKRFLLEREALYEQALIIVVAGGQVWGSQAVATGTAGGVEDMATATV
jgi:hypothetical protein